MQGARAWIAMNIALYPQFHVNILNEWYSYIFASITIVILIMQILERKIYNIKWWICEKKYLYSGTLL